MHKLPKLITSPFTVNTFSVNVPVLGLVRAIGPNSARVGIVFQNNVNTIRRLHRTSLFLPSMASAWIIRYEPLILTYLDWGTFIQNEWFLSTGLDGGVTQVTEFTIPRAELAERTGQTYQYITDFTSNNFTATTTPQRALGGNHRRIGLIVVNQSANPLYFGDVAHCENGNAIFVVTPQSQMILNGDDIPNLIEHEWWFSSDVAGGLAIFTEIYELPFKVGPIVIHPIPEGTMY